ncbi:MAG: hypothetical protein B7C24_17905 [Bacteroidetes bacterium 4572_77]|nr:MAG: hypothetical protein B7C24_17905 [Bacteroidetes bacterium 4572_77]
MSNIKQSGQLTTKKKKLANEKNILKISISLALVFAISLIINSSLFAQALGGGFSQSYMFRSPGGRPSGMAGAFTGVANDAYAIYYNPAGLSFLEYNPSIFVSSKSVGYGRAFSTLVYGQEIMPNLGIGAGLTNFMGGSFIARDVNGNPYGEVTDMHFGANVAASYSMEFMSLGVGLKYLNNTLTNSNIGGTGFGVDIGMKSNVDLGKFGSYSLGACVQNIGGMMLWDGEDVEAQDLLPYCVRIGVGMEFPLNASTIETRSEVTGELETVTKAATRYVLLDFDMVHYQFSVAPEFIVGFDANLHEIIAFRGGLCLWGEKEGETQFLPWTTWSGGFALRPSPYLDLPFTLSIEYNISNEYVSYTGLGHQITLMFAF